MQTMLKQQHRSAVTLIKDECPNYAYGQCLPLDTPCPQCIRFSLICKWFRAAVLPQDKPLHAAIMGGDGVKECAVCHRLFRAVSNRAKYCSECSTRERKKHEAARLRKRRAG